MIVIADVIKRSSTPYTKPAKNLKEITLATSKGPIDITVQAVLPNWAPNRVRIEGHTTYEGHRSCRVTASYHVEIEMEDPVGIIEIVIL